MVPRSSAATARRDVRLDWLRGLAMTCVIVNHSKRSSLLSWFSYERFWVVTAAEVFVVLSGVVLGMVYGRRLARDGWAVVVRGLGRRAAFLYASFVAVTISLLALAAMGLDVTFVAPSNGNAPGWYLEGSAITATVWRDVLLMRAGPWVFEIIGLYVWLVAAAVPCLLMLHRVGWRALLAASWALYVWYRLDPHAVTTAGFESTFPLLTWQLLFVHGVAIGYHREELHAFVARLPKLTPTVPVLLTAGFTLFALCNPWTDGPSWLQWRTVSPDHFTAIYGRFFTLSDLGIGRLLNLAVALPLGYMLLARVGALAGWLGGVFVTLGRRSLGAFVLHVYGLLMLTNVAVPDGLWINTLVQIALVLIIAALLNAIEFLRHLRRHPTPARPQALAA